MKDIRSAKGFQRQYITPEKIKFGQPPLDIEPVLIVLPGAIAPSPEWSLHLSEASTRDGLPIIIERIGWDHSVKLRDVILGYRENLIVSNLAEDLLFLLKKHAGREINVIAHSYGTHALFKAMQLKSEIIFKNIFLIGSIVKSENVRLTRAQADNIFCDMVEYDKISFRLQVWLPHKYQNTSEEGVQPALARCKRWPGGHSSLTEYTHYKEEIFPRILGEKPKNLNVSVKLKRRYQPYSVIFARIQILFTLFIFVSLIAFVFIFCNKADYY